MGNDGYKSLIDKSSTQNSTQTKGQVGDNKSQVLALWRTLALRVKQQPDNLKLHTQRLLFGLENGLSDYLPGALQDLFICLQQKGLPLKQRMFSLLSPVMVHSDRLYFQRWLADGSDSNLKCQRLAGAVFKSETCQPVSELDELYAPDAAQLLDRPAFKNQLEEAYYNLECGQIMKAQALLENICLENENDTKAINELQAIYTYTKQTEALQSFTQRFVENGRTLTETWSKLLETAKSW